MVSIKVDKVSRSFSSLSRRHIISFYDWFYGKLLLNLNMKCLLLSLFIIHFVAHLFGYLKWLNVFFVFFSNCLKSITTCRAWFISSNDLFKMKKWFVTLSITVIQRHLNEFRLTK